MATTTLSRKIGNQTLTFESGKHGPARRRRRHGDVRRDAGARHLRQLQPPRGDRLLPAHDRRRRADVRDRQDPRKLLPPGGPAVRDGGPDLPADRPSAAADVQGRLPRRGPGRHHRARHGRREPLRHRRDERGVRRHVPGRSAVRRSGRLRPDGPDRRPVGREPHVPADGGGDVRRRRRRPPQRVRRDRHPDDRGRGARQHLGAARRRRHRAHRGDGRRGPRGRQGRDRRGDRVPAGVRGRGRRHGAAVGAQAALRRRRVRRGERVRQGPPGRGHRARQGRARGEARRAQGRGEGAPGIRAGRRRSRRARPSSVPRGSSCRRRSCASA